MDGLDQLLNSEDVNGVIIEIDTYINKLCEWGTNFSALSPEQKTIFHTQWLEKEINNGGFNQFFFNSTGDHANETVSALREIGANITADIVQKAIDQFPGSIVPKGATRGEVMDEIEEKACPIWSDLDSKFYDYADDLNALNMAYIKAHKDKF